MTIITSNYPIASYYVAGNGALSAHELATLRRTVAREQVGAPLRTQKATRETHAALMVLRGYGFVVTIAKDGVFVWIATQYGKRVLESAE